LARKQQKAPSPLRFNENSTARETMRGHNREEAKMRFG
jgi:hypothetical protein